MTMKAEFNYWGNYYTVVLPDGSSLRCDNNDDDRRELENELLEEGYYIRWEISDSSKVFLISIYLHSRACLFHDTNFTTRTYL